MGVAKSAVAGVYLLILAIPAGTSARVQSTPPPLERVSPPPSCSFRMDVGMAMRHFPWLRFHLQGVGTYQPGLSYVVHFTSVPWFIPQAHHDADLSMIDPLMWPRRYAYDELGQQGNETLFALRALDDPRLRSATVALGPDGLARSIDATYIDGTHIETQVRSSTVDGFILPIAMEATIDEPHMALSADAYFKDYNFAPQPHTALTTQ